VAGSAVRLNLTQLATLREFARRGTLAAAAEGLGYSPGAVSQHMATLERDLGARLVVKSGRQLVLTDAGRVLSQYADQLLETEREALQAVASVEGRVSGPLIVGTWGSTAAALLAPVVKGLGIRFPEVSLRSREVDVDDAATAVRRGDVDVAFGLDYADAPLPRDAGIAVVRLHAEAFTVALASSRDERTASRAVDESAPPVDTAALQELDWILPPATSQYGRAVRSGFRRRGVEPRVMHEVTDTAASLQLAAAGLGATLMTDLMARLNPNLDVQRWRMTDPLTREIVLITPADVRHRQPIVAFTDVVTEAVTNLSDG
jgi:DNA-binding transcriptional LysR family regulator